MTYSKSLLGISLVGSLAFGWAACGGSQSTGTTTPTPAEQPPSTPPPPPSHSGTYNGNAGTTVTMLTPHAQPARTSEASAEIVVIDGYAPRAVVAGADAGAMAADGSADATAAAEPPDGGTTGITVSLTDSAGGPPCIIHVAMTEANGTVVPGQSCVVTRGTTTATTEVTTGTAAFAGDDLTFDFQANLRLTAQRGRRTETQTGTWAYHFVGHRGGAGGDGGATTDATATGSDATAAAATAPH